MMLLCSCDFLSSSHKSSYASKIENPLLCFLLFPSKFGLPPFPPRKCKDPVARSTTTATEKSAQQICEICLLKIPPVSLSPSFAVPSKLNTCGADANLSQPWSSHLLTWVSAISNGTTACVSV